MGSEAAGADVLFVAALARVRPLVRVQPLVQLEVHELRELCRAQITRIGLLSRMQSQVGFQVRRRAEPLLTDLALVGFLS